MKLLQQGGKIVAILVAITLAESANALTLAEADRFVKAGEAQLGKYGGQCKPWVQTLAASALQITIPRTSANQIAWEPSANTIAVAQWRADYANFRYDEKPLGAKGWVSMPFSVPNGDPNVLVLYAPSTVSATVTNGWGNAVASIGVGSTVGVVSGTFSGSGGYSLRLSNSATTAVTVTAVVLSRSRFVSDFESARRGDVMQMYINANGVTPHTLLSAHPRGQSFGIFGRAVQESHCLLTA
jgi:hypothetical protein